MGGIPAVRKAIEGETFLSFGADRLRRLCRAVEMHDEEPAVLEVFERFTHPWNRSRIGSRPRYPSHVSDDRAPVELSAAFSAREAEIQVYWEPQGESPSLASNMTAGLAVLRELFERYDLSTARWRAIEDLFFPERPRGPFTMLLGVTWSRGQAPRFKLYLNPYVRGTLAMPALMQEAMARLGFARAWATDQQKHVLRSADLDEITLVCLDLARGPGARVKVYRRHYRATVAQLEGLAGIARDFQPGDAERFYGLVAGQPGPFLSKPPITTLTYREGDDDRPGSVTLEYPLSSYVADDAASCDRVERAFAAYGLDPSRYRRAIDAIRTRPLDQGNGIHAHITHRRVNGGPRLALYFATEAYPVDGPTWVVQPESVRVPVERAPAPVTSPGS